MYCKLIFTVLAAVVIQHIVRFILATNAFQKVFNHGPGPCKQLPSVVHGSEKAFLLENGLLYISSGFGAKNGKILKYDFESTFGDVEEFRFEDGFDSAGFSSHGFGGWQDPKTGLVTLFVVNHHSEGERVEVFQHDGSKSTKTLKHLKTIRDPNMKFLNDIVATGPDSFYATNFVTFDMTIEYFLLYSGGWVLRYDQGKTTILDSGLRLANGINMSPDQKYLYVIDGGRQSVISYRIQNDKSLKRVQVYNLGTGPDNIYVDRKTGDLWIGCHPNAIVTGIHLSYPKENYPSYSQVLKLTVVDGNVVDTVEVYANDGSQISCSSTAVPYKNKLFVGSVIEKAIVCDLIYVG